jgi:hypothetical protein
MEARGRVPVTMQEPRKVGVGAEDVFTDFGVDAVCTDEDVAWSLRNARFGSIRRSFVW